MADPTAPVRIKILFFASARESAGISSLELALDPPADSKLLRTVLADRFPRLNSVLDEDSVTLALNEEYIPAGKVVQFKNGDTVALIPPISGG